MLNQARNKDHTNIRLFFRLHPLPANNRWSGLPGELRPGLPFACGINAVTMAIVGSPVIRTVSQPTFRSWPIGTEPSNDLYDPAFSLMRWLCQRQVSFVPNRIHPQIPYLIHSLLNIQSATDMQSRSLATNTGPVKPDRIIDTFCSRSCRLRDMK